MELQAWMNKQGIEATGQPTYAYYNDPLTPGCLRRNEVLFDVIKPSNDLENAHARKITRSENHCGLIVPTTENVPGFDRRTMIIAPDSGKTPVNAVILT